MRAMRACIVLALVASEVLATSLAPVNSFLPTFGPILPANSYVWRKIYTPVIIGTVIIAVNEATNKTSSATVYHSEYLSSTDEVPTPTALNAAGTRIAQIGETHITYPADYFTAGSELTWTVMWPYTATGAYNWLDSPGVNAQLVIKDLGRDGTCCYPSYTVFPTPSHAPFKQTTQPIDEEDPRGLLYDLVAADGQQYTQLEGDQVSTLFSPTPLTFQYRTCMYAICTNVSLTAAGPAFAVPSIVGIFATSSTTISVDNAEASPSSTPLSPIPAAYLPSPTQGPTSLTHVPGTESSYTATYSGVDYDSEGATPVAVSYTVEATSSTRPSSLDSDSTSITTITETSTRTNYITVDDNIPDSTDMKPESTPKNDGRPSSSKYLGQSRPISPTPTPTPPLFNPIPQTSFSATNPAMADRETSPSSDLRFNTGSTPQSLSSSPTELTSSRVEAYTSQTPSTQTTLSRSEVITPATGLSKPVHEHTSLIQTLGSPRLNPSVEITTSASPKNHQISSSIATAPSRTPADSPGSRTTTSQSPQNSSSTANLGQLISQGLVPSEPGPTPTTASLVSVVKSSSANALTRMRVLEHALNLVSSLWAVVHLADW